MAVQKFVKNLFISSVWFNVVSSQVLPRNASSTTHYRGSKTPCLAADVTDISNRHLLRTDSARNIMDCLRQCYRSGQCEVVLYNNSNLCLHFGPAGDVSVYNVDLRVDSCHIVYLNPCQNGAPFVNGMCQCSKSYTGQYCQLVNDERCNNPFKMIHGFDEISSVDDLDTLEQYEHAQYKMAFVKDAWSYMVAGPVEYNRIIPSASVVFQVHNSISKLNLSSYDTNPHIEQYVLRAQGRLQDVSMTFEGTLVEKNSVNVLRMSIFVRFPVTEYVLSSDGVDGTEDDIIEAIQRGYEPLGVQAITFDESDKFMVKHQPGRNIAMRKLGEIISPVYIVYKKSDANGEGTGNVYLNGDSTYPINTANTAEAAFDPCWFDATADIRQPETNKAIDYLKTALRNGKRARVVFDGISAQTGATYITSDYVLFQAGPYLTPKYNHEIDEKTTLVHSIVSSDGRVKTCSHDRLYDTTAVNQSSYVVDDAKWFLDSRIWEQIYETEIDGTFVSGDLKELEEKVNSGVDVQIVVETPKVTYSFPGGWMTTDPWQMTKHDVSAEIKDVLTLEVNDQDFGYIDTEFCTISNILISSNVGWQAINVNYGPDNEFYVDTLNSIGKIKWFVSGHE